MKLTISFLTIFIIVVLNIVNGQNLFSGPECVSFDSLNNRYIVCNWTDGNVIAVDSAGNHSYFVKGLGHAYGNCILDSTIFVSNGTSIFGFNLFNPEDTLFTMQVPAAQQMDGMTTDNNHNLYVVDVVKAAIFKINLINKTSTIFATGLSTRPQDVIYDEKNNRLLVCSWYSNSPIQAVSLNDSSVTDLVNTSYGNCDGLAMDENGNVYFSTWTNNSIYYYDSTFTNPPIKLSGGHSGPANICYNFRDRKIIVPSFNSNSLQYVQLTPVQTKDETSIPAEFELLQNYPNPFNPETKITYHVPKESQVVLKVYNVLGSCIQTLVDEFQQIGYHSVEFKPGELSSGMYFYTLTVEEYSHTRKMLYIK